MAGFELHLPGIRGKQAGHDFYLVMCPLRHLPRLFRFDDDGIQPELQAQRVLNKGRVPEIARYITENPDSYVLSSIVGSIDRDVHVRAGRRSGRERRAGNVEAADFGPSLDPRRPPSPRRHRGGLAAQARTRRRDHFARPVRRSRVSEIGADLLGPETPRVSFLSLPGNPL